MRNEKEFLTGMITHLKKDHIPDYEKRSGLHALKGGLWWLFGSLGLVKGVLHFMASSDYSGARDVIGCEIEMLNNRLTEVKRNEDKQ